MDRNEIAVAAREVGPMRVAANETMSLWVIGHRVTLLPVGGRIAAVEVVTRRVCPVRPRTTTWTPMSAST
jgi:hypothetical protein